MGEIIHGCIPRNWTCHIPEGEHRDFHVLNTARSIVLVGFWWLAETCRRSRSPSRLRQSGGAQDLWNIQFGIQVYGGGSVAYPLPLPIFEPQDLLVWPSHPPKVLPV